MATATKKTVVTEEESVVDILQPELIDFQFILGEDGPEPITFLQKPLSFFGKIELFSVLSGTLRKIMEKDVSISDLIGGSEDAQTPLSGDVKKDADTFLKTLTQVVEYAPEALGDIFCVILAVPRKQREVIKERIEDDLTDEQAFAVLNTFVDQNWEILVDFFTGKGLSLFRKISQKFQG